MRRQAICTQQARRMLARRLAILAPRSLSPSSSALAACGPGPLAQPPRPALVQAPDASGPLAGSSAVPITPPRGPRGCAAGDAPDRGAVEGRRCDAASASSLRRALPSPRVIASRAGAQRESDSRVPTHAGFVAVERFWLDPRAPQGRKYVDRRSADVCVLLLERPIALATYPQIARRPAPGSVTATGLRRSAIGLRPSV